MTLIEKIMMLEMMNKIIKPTSLSLLYPADIQDRYNRMERQVAERSNTLQMTRMQCLSLQDSLHSLLIWLEEKENTFDKLEKGTRMMIKRNALMEQLQQHKV